MRSWAALLPVLMAVGGGVAAAEEIEAEPYAQAFCSLRTADGGKARIHLLSPSLVAAITEALEKNAALQAAAPDEKPPLGDGIPYQSHPDHAPECRSGAVAIEGDSALVTEVVYSFPDDPQAGWTDRLVLVEAEGGAYVIDDIRYGAEGDADTLRAFLDTVFDDL